MKLTSFILTVLVLISHYNIQALKVYSISDDAINAAIEELRAQDKLRSKFQILAVLGAVGIGYSLWRWQNAIDAYNKVELTQEQKDTLQRMSENFKKESDAKLQQLTGFEWLGAKVYGTAHSLFKASQIFLGVNVPHIIANVLVSSTVLPFHKYILRAQKLSDYLLMPHTITWFLERKINFKGTIEHLVTWERKEKDAEQLLPLLKKELSHSVNALVKDIEYALAYIKHITSKLAESRTLEHETSLTIQNILRLVIQNLVDNVNNFIAKDHTLDEFKIDSLSINLAINHTLRQCIASFSNFEFVQEAASYSDDEQKTTFKQLEKALKDSKVNPTKAMIRKIVTKKLQKLADQE